MVLAGHSQGGGVASIAALFGSGIEARWEEYALARGGPPRQVDCEITDGSTHVDAIVGLGGTHDMFVGYEESDMGVTSCRTETRSWGGRVRLDHREPDLRVRLLHGETDTVVPHGVSVAVEVVLAEAGYDVRLIPFDGGHWEPGGSDLFVTTNRGSPRPIGSVTGRSHGRLSIRS